MSDAERIAKVQSYEGEPICPCCGNNYPVCAEFVTMSQPAAHDFACARYQWDDGLCATCDARLERELGG